MNVKASLLLSAVGLAAALDLGVALRGDLEPVPGSAMERAKEEIEARKRPGDHVVFSPLFSVEELQPLGRLRARPDRPPDRLMRTRRVVVLDRADHPMYLPGDPTDVVALDPPLELRIYEPEDDAAVTVFDLYDQLSERTMRVERKGRITSRCTARRAEGGFRCPGEPEWIYAARRSLRIGGGEALCVWAHPTTGGAVVYTLPPQATPPAGRVLELVVSAGLDDSAVQGTPGGASVTTAVTQSGKRTAILVVPNRIGWVEKKVRIEPEVPVELRVTTPRDGRRHHCINAKIVERPE